MAGVPIHMKPVTAHIRAHPKLAFQVVMGFASAQNEPDSPKVLRQKNGRLLVEFQTPIHVGFGVTKTFRTTEWVTPHEPERIDFELAREPGRPAGGMDLLQDRFTFEERDGCTDFRYDSAFAIRWSILGWLLAKLWAERALGRHMRSHTESLKAMIEERARRSRVFSQTCQHGEE